MRVKTADHFDLQKNLRFLDGVLGVSVTYGTREDQDGGSLEVDLAHGIDYSFHLSRASKSSGGCWLKKSQSSGDGFIRLGRALDDAGLVDSRE